jgi:hypothetical protein
MVWMSDSQPKGRGFESRRGICEQDTLKSTALGSQNKQNCLRHVPLTSVKKINIEERQTPSLKDNLSHFLNSSDDELNMYSNVQCDS